MIAFGVSRRHTCAPSELESIYRCSVPGLKLRALCVRRFATENKCFEPGDSFPGLKTQGGMNDGDRIQFLPTPPLGALCGIGVPFPGV